MSDQSELKIAAALAVADGSPIVTWRIDDDVPQLLTVEQARSVAQRLNEAAERADALAALAASDPANRRLLNAHAAGCA